LITFTGSRERYERDEKPVLKSLIATRHRDADVELGVHPLGALEERVLQRVLLAHPVPRQRTPVTFASTGGGGIA
jgi:hypothetical protein